MIMAIDNHLLGGLTSHQMKDQVLLFATGTAVPATAVPDEPTPEPEPAFELECEEEKDASGFAGIVIERVAQH